MTIRGHKTGKTTLIALFLLILPMLSGCGLRSIDDALGRGFEKAKSGDFLSLFDYFFTEHNQQIIEALPDISNFDFKNLSKEQKEYIDKWLGEHGFNRYGDPEGTSYASGTPLLDPETGQSLERYKYIIEHVPDLVDKIRGVVPAEASADTQGEENVSEEGATEESGDKTGEGIEQEPIQTEQPNNF